jgi:hypothetical protein
VPRKSTNNIKVGRKPKAIFKPKHRATIDNVVVAGVALKELELCGVMYLAAFVAKRQRTLTPPVGQKYVYV